MLTSPLHLTQLKFKQLLRLYIRGHRYISATAIPIQAGDRVLIQAKGKDPFLSKILRPDGSTSTQHGELFHTDIIGKRTRDTVTTSKGTEIRVFLPTLAEYVTMTPRNVTPIYPTDASLIISLLDLHVSPLKAAINRSPSLEILEAGTGHGALTLYLARAIHAANAYAGSDVLSERRESDDPFSDAREKQLSVISNDLEQKPVKDYHGQNDQRQAIVHTVDRIPKHQNDARAMIKGFRQGLYSDNIDFHIGDASEWIDQQIADRRLLSKDLCFLSHVLLDMPKADQHIEKAAGALQVNGNLVVFNPSITQIMAIVDIVKTLYLPLQLERILELGSNMTGGKEWDIRAVRPKGLAKATVEDLGLRNIKRPRKSENEDQAIPAKDANPLLEIGSNDYKHPGDYDSGWEMVCRPKVGDRIAGGGFLGVWKKMKW